MYAVHKLSETGLLQEQVCSQDQKVPHVRGRDDRARLHMLGLLRLAQWLEKKALQDHPEAGGSGMSWFNWSYRAWRCARCHSKITVHPCCYCRFSPGAKQ